MKKIFTLFAALTMVMSMSAATKTIYFKTQQWWHKDDAASAAYYWDPSAAPTWPGIRMTKVDGVADMWSVDVDTDKYKNIIFTRVNGSGNVEDWGAKTQDLVIPTDDKNLFTLSTTEVWGGSGASGTWSVYAPDAPKTYKDITITVVANATPKIHYWEGGDKVTGSEWETKPDMVATGEENTYSYTIKDVDEATGVKYLIVVGEVQSADQQAFENVTANFKDLLPQVVVMGVTGWTGDKMTVADDYLSASVTLNLKAATDYELKLTVNGQWYGSNAITITKDNNSASFAENGEGNGKLTTDLAGDYVFTYTYATKTLVVTYPVPTPTYTVTLLNEVGAELEGAGEYEEGSVATVIAPEEWDGYIFVSWVDEEGNGVSDDATTTVTVNQDITLTALYAMMMPLEVTDLEIITDPVVGLIGSTELASGTLSLQLVVDASAEPGEDGERPLTEDSQIWLGEDTQYEFLEGIALIDMENNTAQAIVLAADDWGMIYYFVIEMSAAAPAEPTEVVVENAIITVEEQSDGMGGTYELVNVTAEWNGTLLKLEGIEKNFEGFLQITQIVDEATDDWYIWMAMNGTVTTVDNVLTVSGEFTNNWTGDVYNVTISGELDNTTTALDNVTTTVAPAKAIVNGQLVIVKDGVKYNAQGAVVK